MVGRPSRGTVKPNDVDHPNAPIFFPACHCVAQLWVATTSGHVTRPGITRHAVHGHRSDTFMSHCWQNLCSANSQRELGSTDRRRIARTPNDCFPLAGTRHRRSLPGRLWLGKRKSSDLQSFFFSASYQQASAALSSALLRITLEHPRARKAT